uniref:Ubiquitin-associated domain-containing protein 2 n=1 Tax=Oryctolagus cuniculus TaxID=9986 RepID=A0A5F9DP61_RABIT
GLVRALAWARRGSGHKGTAGWARCPIWRERRPALLPSASRDLSHLAGHRNPRRASRKDWACVGRAGRPVRGTVKGPRGICGHRGSSGCGSTGGHRGTAPRVTPQLHLSPFLTAAAAVGKLRTREPRPRRTHFPSPAGREGADRVGAPLSRACAVRRASPRVASRRRIHRPAGSAPARSPGALHLRFPSPWSPAGAPSPAGPCSPAPAPVGFTRRLCRRAFCWSPAPCPFCWLCCCLTVRSSLSMTSMQSRTTSSLAPVFALFVPFYCSIPRVQVAQILGPLSITNKTLIYILGLQLFTSGSYIWIVAISGLVSGMCYDSKMLQVHQVLRVPSWMAKFFSRTLEPIFSSSEPTSEARIGMGATVDIQRQQRMELLDRQLMLSQFAQVRRQRQQQGGMINWNRLFPPLRQRRNINFPDGRRSEQQASPPLEVSEEQVARLMEMGFSRGDALEALRASNNDLNVATNFLLQH